MSEENPLIAEFVKEHSDNTGCRGIMVGTAIGVLSWVVCVATILIMMR